MPSVRRIHPMRRDSAMLSFPCYEVNARFDHGMSGGIVVDESGALCGLICCSLPAGNPEDYAVSRVKTLWPMLRTLISADRDGHYPKGVTYPMIDLALDGLIGVNRLSAARSAIFSWPRITKSTRFGGYISRLVRQKAVLKSVQEVRPYRNGLSLSSPQTFSSFRHCVEDGRTEDPRKTRIANNKQASSLDHRCGSSTGSRLHHGILRV